MSNVELVMISSKDMAAELGVSPQAVSKKLKKILVENDVPVERDSRGRIVSFSKADYLLYLETFANPQQTPKQKPSDLAPLTNSRDEALRQTAWIDLRKKDLQLQLERGALVRADVVTEAMEKIGRKVQSIINRLPNKADDLALVVTQSGVSGLRNQLKEISFLLCDEVAAELSQMEIEAPEEDKLESIGPDT